MVDELTCFKKYDVRGVIDVNINEEICYRIATAFAVTLKAEKVVVGKDVRETSSAYATSVINALIDQGVCVIDIGLSGTEEMYWATSFYKACGGIEITASHNPINYNGMKMVKHEAIPLDPSNEFLEIKRLAELNNFEPSVRKGTVHDLREQSKRNYTRKIVSFLGNKNKRKMKILINSGNGTGAHTFPYLEKAILEKSSLFEFIKINSEPDGTFPNGIPNPILKENQPQTSRAVLDMKADLGIAFDGDFDRCFFFDEKGNFVSGEYIVGLLAEIFLDIEPKGKIVHDTRLIWNTTNIVSLKRGNMVSSKTGHAFMKFIMRRENAIYGGEISAHHYFRDFAYCDSGMIPWVVIASFLSEKGQPLSHYVDERTLRFPSSGERNYQVDDPQTVIQNVVEAFEEKCQNIDHFDGVSLAFDNWRFNIRPSNTENVVRLNVEGIGNKVNIGEKILKIESILMR